MARSSIPFALPPFRGVTRRISLLVLGYWLLVLLISLVAPSSADLLTYKFSLSPDETLSLQLWQPLTYSLVYLPHEVLSVILGVLSFWFFASELESERGSVWLAEFLALSAVLGGFLAAILVRFVMYPLTGMVPTDYIWGLAPLNIALLVVYARLYPNRELVFNFVLRMKVKYLAAIYVLIYVGNTMTTGHRFDTFVALCVTICGLTFLQLFPRRGLRASMSERWYGLQNAYARYKRRRAAKNFTVYMKKQGKDVNLDASGRYVSLEDEQRDPKDPRWRN